MFQLIIIILFTNCITSLKSLRHELGEIKQDIQSKVLESMYKKSDDETEENVIEKNECLNITSEEPELIETKPDIEALEKHDVNINIFLAFNSLTMINICLYKTNKCLFYN